MTRAWVLIGAAVSAALATIPVVARARQDAPLSGIHLATFHGPLNCGPPPPPRPTRGPPRCTYRPLDATVLVVDLEDGHVVARVRTHADGRGTIALSAGAYEVRAGRAHGVLALAPQPKRVQLEPGESADVILDYDPGDR